MLRLLLTMLAILSIQSVISQELYVYTDPASNVPARSLSVKGSANLVGKKPQNGNRFLQRYTAETMFGINKKWMLRSGLTFADMYTTRFRWESVYLYAKYRFLSNDDLHSHFRMAVFADAAYTRSPFHFDEVSLQGDKSGVQLGMIATWLKGKLAISGTVSHIQVLDEDRNDHTVVYDPSRIYQVMNYSLSGGYLVLPLEYTDYRQTNLNVYAEIIAQQSLDRKAWFADLAPAVQLIFNSNAKLNFGYRFELSGTMKRMSNNSWLISFERTFLNAFKKK